MAAPEGPPPPMKDDAPDIVVTVVHKVKSKLGYTEIHTPAPPMDENGKELVAANPSQKNWKGISIAVCVILLVLASVAISVQIMTPPEEGPRVLGDRITVSHILNPDYRPRHFNGSWISDNELVFLDSEGGLSILEVDSLNQSQIVNNIVFRRFDVDEYSLSPSRNFVLLIHNKQKRYRYSYTAEYTIFEISTQRTWKVSAQDIDNDDLSSLRAPRLQHASWLPNSDESSHSGSAIVFVEDYSIYYIPDVGKYGKREIFPISSSERLSDAIIHGIPDWIYEEDILKRANAIWPSPDGNKLVYATFNDSEVQQVRWKVYEDTSEGNLDPYPKEKHMYYPKAGTKNPTVTIWRVDFTDSSNLQSVQLKPPQLLKDSDYYFTSVSWSKSGSVAVIWMNRAQNLSIATDCAAPSFICEEKYRDPADNGDWSTLYQPPYYSEDSKYYLLVTPQEDRDHGKYLHITKVDLSQPNTSNLEHSITLGPFEVQKILAWDEKQKHIFFQGIPADNPSARHIYSVKDDSGTSAISSRDSVNTPICLTCKLPEKVNRSCTYSDAIFSNSFEYFVLKCLGPDIPSSYLLKLTKSEINAIPTNEKDQDSLNEVDKSSERTNVQLELIHVLDSNNDSVQMLNGLAWPRVEICENITMSTKGQKVRGKLYLPPELRKNEITKFPMVVHVYGGPGSQLVTDQWKFDMNHVMSSGQSYIVIEIDGAGTGGQGEANKMEVKRKLGQREVQDQLDAIRYMLNKYPFIDENRIAASGVSYGGYAVGMMLAKSGEESNSKIRCGIAVSPVVEWRYYESAYTERYMGLPTEESNSHGYEQGSLLRKAKKLSGKRVNLFLAHGMADTNVHLQNSMVLAKELVRHNVTFQQQFYPNEGHNLDGVKRHLFNTVLNFLERCFAEDDSASIVTL